MLAAVLGSNNRERVLIFLQARGSGYAREIAAFFNTDPTPVQKQLERLENAGVICAKAVGKTVVFSFNPRYPFLRELGELLEKALSFYPEEIRRELLENRRRPRRRGKVL